MARQVQLRRGTTAQTSTFTGAVAEVTVDTDKNTVVIHDGSTAGGHPITSDQTVVLTDGTGISTSGTYPNFTITNSAPDQTVVLTDGTGITTSGTYPNFTITNSAPDQTVAITGGENVVVTGTYPNFTVASTASGGTHDFVASGAISNGDVVVLNSDGTVSTVTVTNPELNPVTLGTPAAFNSVDTGKTSAVYDPVSKKVVVFYKDFSTTYVTAIVGTVSGTSISFGTPVVVESNSGGTYLKATYDTASDKVVVFYSKYLSGQEEHGRAAVGTVSGTSISFGTIADFAASNSPLVTFIDAAYDSGNSKHVIVWNNSVVTNRGSTAIVGTVSGTSITFGTPTIYDSTSRDTQWVAYDANAGKVLVGYRVSDAPNNTYVGTVSGTSISFGSPTSIATRTESTTALYDPVSQKILVAYLDTSSGNPTGVTKVATISGTSVSYGSASNFQAGDGGDYASISMAYSSVTGSFLIAWRDLGASKEIKLRRATISGTTASFEAEVTSGLLGESSIALAYDANAIKFVLLYGDDAAADTGKGAVITETSTVSDVNSYLGVAAEDIADTATGSVTVIGGVNEGQTGLTVNTSYFLDDDGSLITANNGRKLGKAVATTKLLVDTAMSGSEMNEYLGGLV